MRVADLEDSESLLNERALPTPEGAAPHEAAACLRTVRGDRAQSAARTRAQHRAPLHQGSVCLQV